jgi:hypothetical protein
MDPKTLASLDPKLRETYERVMGATSDTNPVAATPSTDTATATPTTAPTPTASQPPSADQLPTTNPFATPPFEAVDTNPAHSSDTTPDTNLSQPLTETNAGASLDTTTLNADGLSSAFPTPQTPEANPFLTTPQPDNQPLPTVGSNTVDMNSFNLNPMGQRTDQTSVPAQDAPQPVNPVVPFTPETPSPSTPTQTSFAAPNINQAKPVSSTLRILYIFAGVVFFMIYTFFWLKIFKFPLPF